MTNEKLIKKFFSGKCSGREESYGFLIKRMVFLKVGLCRLRSKQSPFPLVTEIKRGIFLITTYSNNCLNNQFRQHFNLVIKTAINMKVTFFQAPWANKNLFHEYMEGEINFRLRCLAGSLKAGDYTRVCLDTDKYEYHDVEPMGNIPTHKRFVTGPENYQKLMLSFKTLIDGERLMDLPKKQIQLLDTEEVHNAWVWLIKEGHTKEDQEFLRNQYMKSKMLRPKRD